MRDIAERRGSTPAQVALAWVLARRDPVVIPILGARTTAQLEENLAARNVVLTGAEVTALDAASAVDLGFPHDFLRSDLAQFALWGNVRSRVLTRV